MQPYGESVTLLRYSSTTQDALGDDVKSFSSEVFDKVPVWIIDANGYAANEVLGGRDTVTIGYAMLLPRDTEVGPYDRAIVRDGLYEVDGHPNQIRSFFTGWYPGIMVNLRLVVG